MLKLLVGFMLSNLEFIWIFKNTLQKQQKLRYHLSDIDTSAFRVLQILLSNLIWYKNKSWSLHLGEEHTKSWIQFEEVLTTESEFPGLPSRC